MPGLYAAEPVVVEQYSSIFRMAADGTGTHELSLRARLQTAQAIKDYGVVSVQYAGNSEHVEFDYVRVRREDGSVAETAVDDALEMPLPVTQSAPFYSDLKQKQLPVRNLRPGDTLEWKARIIRTRAEAAGQFWSEENFIQDAVVRSQVLELHVPPAVKVTVSSPASKPVETSAGPEHVYRWEHAQLKPTVGPEAEAAKEAKKKAVWTADQELDWREGKLPDVAWTTFADWAAVGAWYQTLETDRTAPDDAIRAKVAELTAGKTTDEAKARAVYQYVDSQIRYIGVSFGIGRFQPHHAAEVFENQYGDCKDKHTLLAAMLEVLGLKPRAVLIGYAVRFNQPVPSPGSFNHAITQVQLGGRTVWLDSTQDGSPFEVLSALLRDRRALVVPEPGAGGEATIETTPAGLPFPSFQQFNAEGTLDAEGVSNSRIVLTLRGDTEVAIREAFDQVSPGQYGELVQTLANSIGYAGTTSKPEVSGREDTAQPLKVSFDYKRDRAGDWANLRIIPQLAPNPLPRPDIKTPPVADIELGTPRVETSSSAMKLPAGWTAELPDPIHQKCVWATFDQTYRREFGSVFATRRIEVLAQRVPQAEWKAYSNFAEAADLGNENYIVLARGPGGENALVTAGPADASAAELIRHAQQAMLQMDMTTATRLLTRAGQLTHAPEPDPQGLWITWGALHSQQAKWAEAASDFRKELELHPASYNAYPALASVQERMGKRTEAEATLKAWSAAQPDDPAPARRLMASLMNDGNPAAAVAAGREAEKRLPEDKRSDPGFQFALGKAELLTPGEKEAGHARLLALLEPPAGAAPEPSDLVVNDAGYELANAGLELPLVEASTRKVLASLDEAGRSWTLASLSEDSKRQSRLEAAAWDTMGWVLFREGKPQDALSWIRAAWANRHSAVEGEHAGDVYVALGKQDLADVFYRSVRGRATDESKTRLDRKIDTLERAGAKPYSREDADVGISHPLALGKANGLKGSSEYRLLLRAGKAVEVEPVGSNVVQGGAQRILAVSFETLFPAGSQATLVRAAVLNCYNGACTLFLED